MGFYSTGDWYDFGFILLGFFLSGWLTGFLFNYVRRIIEKVT